MSIMQNKVSRRIALGSIAGGLAGTVAVLQVLRSKYAVDVPDISKKLQVGWKDAIKKFDVPIKPIEVLSKATIEYKPEVGKHFRVIYMDAMYDDTTYPVEYSQTPFLYTFMDGQATVIPPVDSTTIALHISTNKKMTWTRQREIERSGCNVILGLVDGKRKFFENDNGTIVNLPLTKRSSTCMLLGASVLFEYPKKSDVDKGMKWINASHVHPTDNSDCTATGFAEVAGFQTAVFTAEEKMSNQQWQDYTVALIQQAREEDKKSGNSDGSKHIEKNLKRIIQEKATRESRKTWYVDLKTGITVRRESVTIRRSPKVKDQIDLAFSQIFKS